MKLVLNAVVTGLQGNSGLGSISLNTTGGIPPYSYNWSSGEKGNSINRARGLYSVTVTDDVGRTQTNSYNIGYKIDWINRTGVNTSGDVLTKNVALTSWTNSGAVSSNLLPSNTNGWIEFITGSASYFAIGLTVNNTIHYTQFSNGILVDNGIGNFSSLRAEEEHGSVIGMPVTFFEYHGKEVLSSIIAMVSY